MPWGRVKKGVTREGNETARLCQRVIIYEIVYFIEYVRPFRSGVRWAGGGKRQGFLRREIA